MVNFVTNNQTILVSVAVACITILLSLAMYFGHNGVILASGLASIVGIIAGVLGFEIGKKR